MTKPINRFFGVGDKLKRIRTGLGMNQIDFSKMIGISRSTYSNYENNNRVPNEKVLRQMAEALDIPFSEFLGISTTQIEFVEDFDISVFDEEVMNYITNIKNELRRISKGEVSNTLVLQNIIIDRIAEEEVLKELKMYPQRTILTEFEMDSEGNMRTGQEIKASLKQVYKDKWMKEKVRKLETSFPSILYYDDEALEMVRDYYDDIPKVLIKDYILEKLYPEYLEEAKETEIRLKKMRKKTDDYLSSLSEEEQRFLSEPFYESDEPD